MRLSRFPISTLLDSASGHLEAHLYKKRLAAESGEPLAQQYSGIIFSGNPKQAAFYAGKGSATLEEISESEG